MIDVTVKIGGEAGQGIQTVGELLALMCKASGLHIMAVNDFESRIRGGHNFFQIRISDRPVQAPHHDVHLLVGLDRQTLAAHRDEVVAGGVILMEKKLGIDDPDVLPVPFLELAENAGGKITSNTAAAGACLSLLGASMDAFKEVLSTHFGGKGEDAVEKNLNAAALGYQAVENETFQHAFEWRAGGEKRSVIDGNRAFALGALAGDCRFVAFYPMSPATEIVARLAAMTDTFPLVVEQAEDEIAAVNMVIGASFAGVRAMTSTSGGGFCLMTEGLGLAGITETPLVIINAQRPGPATGLPTRTAQGDLLFVIRASQDEFPRFVFAPGSPEQAYAQTARAFHLSEKYQVPVIILTDQYLNDSMFTLNAPLKAPQNVERFIIGPEEIERPESYQRYALTPSGISPRALPCAGEALVMSTGNEHRPDGHLSEKISDRISQVDKRQAKQKAMLVDMQPPESIYGDAESIIVGWGSTRGAVLEAVDWLRKDGADVGGLLFSDMWPFPAEAVRDALAGGKRFFMAECNRTAQLGALIREQTGLSYSGAILKYDGRPIFPKDIVEQFKQQAG